MEAFTSSFRAYASPLIYTPRHRHSRRPLVHPAHCASRVSNARPPPLPPLPPPPPPPSFRSPAFAFCNALEDAITKYLEPRPCSGSESGGNFEPVDELPPTPCPVVHGSIPACLGGGAYVRVGPNPLQLQGAAPHHLFDGDGMVHSIMLPPGGGQSPATICSRYVRTNKFVLGSTAGSPVVPNFFNFHGAVGVARCVVWALRILTGQVDLSQGMGAANTSLAFFGGRLFALGEPDIPYAIHLSPHDGDITTVERCSFGGKLVRGMTAHPKADPATGEVFAFRNGYLPPFLTYFSFDRDGNKRPDLPIYSLRQPTFIHDFAITEHFAVFPDTQMVVRPIGMALQGKPLVELERGKTPRVGVIPRHAKAGREMRWFDAPGFNPIHIINAWEECGGDVVVLLASNALNIEHLIRRMELVRSCVEMVRIDLRNGELSRAPLSARNLEFGVINPAFRGKKSRYAYLGAADPVPKMSGVVKLDLEKAREGEGDCGVASRHFGPGRFGGEPFFVAAGGEEDDGYVMCYVHNERTEESRFVVMEGAGLEVVAEVALPRRVPYGFHGLFVSADELRSQPEPKETP